MCKYIANSSRDDKLTIELLEPLGRGIGKLNIAANPASIVLASRTQPCTCMCVCICVWGGEGSACVSQNTLEGLPYEVNPSM